MRFKVGDKVKIVKNTHPENKAKYGDIGTVCRIDLNNASYPILLNEYDTWLMEDWLKLLESEVTMKDAKYGVQYDRNGDPVEFFKTKAKATKRIEELLDDSEVDKKSIKLFTVGQVWEVKKQIEFELVKV